MQILNLCLTFVFLLMAYVSLRHGAELPTTPLGRTLLGGFALFWFLRLIEQLAFFDASKPRSLAFMLAFFIGGLLYTLPLVLGA